MKNLETLSPKVCVQTHHTGNCLMSAQYVMLDLSQKQNNMEFPKIKGLKWMSKDYPDLICIKIIMVNKTQYDLGIPELNSEETLVDIYLDLSRLACIKDWWEKDAEEPSKTECCVDFSGIPQMVLVITKEELLKAWIFYKNFKYDTRNI